jgi:hypothetical protein
VCDSLENIEIADRDALRSEVEVLWAFHERRLRTGVPPEYLTDRVAFSQHLPLRVCPLPDLFARLSQPLGAARGVGSGLCATDT